MGLNLRDISSSKLEGFRLNVFECASFLSPLVKLQSVLKDQHGADRDENNLMWLKPCELLIDSLSCLSHIDSDNLLLLLGDGEHCEEPTR